MKIYKSQTFVQEEIRAMFDSMLDRKLNFNKLGYAVFAAAMVVTSEDASTVLKLTWSELFNKIKNFKRIDQKLSLIFKKLCDFFYDWKESIYGFYDIDINKIPVFSDLINPENPTVVDYPVGNAKRWLSKVAHENFINFYELDDFSQAFKK